MRWPALVAALLLLLAVAPAAAQPIAASEQRAHPVRARGGMVASQEARATRIGVAILRRGGNAIDAAVATAFALAVTLPRAGNLGGGGFMLVHHAASGKTVAIDFREVAPAAARAEMFVGKARKEIIYHPLMSGVPGSVAGLLLAHARYGSGKISRAELLAPAIQLAAEGLVVRAGMADALAGSAGRLGRWPSTRAVFYDGDRPLREGARLRQPELAWSLRQIADRGAAGFYRGELARRLVAAVREAGGQWTLADLAGYRALEREPLVGRYRGHTIYAMPLPSSGGVTTLQILGQLERSQPAAAGSAAALHRFAEASRRAFADRSRYLGDPAFFDKRGALTPAQHAQATCRRLLDGAYLDRLAASIGERATPTARVKPGALLPPESAETTHLSVGDGAGNWASLTTTLNFSFGCGLVAKGTGILLNNELDDFVAQPGVPNAYGLVGGKRNAIAAGKRPLSSMAPTLVASEGTIWLATGSPGGSRIITTVAQQLIGLIDHRLNLASATLAPRVHHQWLPDRIEHERGVSPDTLALLRARGHVVKRRRAMGSLQSVRRVAGGFRGFSDTRRAGALSAGVDESR